MKTGNSSFRALFGDGQRLEIPVIQRDYAQGRRTNTAKRFAGALSKRLVRHFHQTRRISGLSISTLSTAGGRTTNERWSRSTASSGGRRSSCCIGIWRASTTPTKIFGRGSRFRTAAHASPTGRAQLPVSSLTPWFASPRPLARSAPSRGRCPTGTGLCLVCAELDA